MRKLLVMAVILATTLGIVSVVRASTRACGSLRCVNRQITRLSNENDRMQTQINKMQAQIDQLAGGQDPKLYDCLREIPVSVFNDYLADDGVTSITALDVDSPSNPDYWTIVDVCYTDQVFPDA